MNFKEYYVVEKFAGASTINGKYIEWFIEPTKKELRDLSKKTSDNYMRIGIVDNPKIDIYAWDGDITHDHMHKHIKFQLNIGFVFNDSEMDMLDNGEWVKFKNKDKFKKKIKKMFPKIKVLNVFPSKSGADPEVITL